MTHPHETRRQHSSQAHSPLARIPNRGCPPPPSFLCHPELLRRIPLSSRRCRPSHPKRFPRLASNRLNICLRHRRIYRSHVHHPSTLRTVEPSVTRNCIGVVKVEDEPPVTCFTLSLF